MSDTHTAAGAAGQPAAVTGAAGAGHAVVVGGGIAGLAAAWELVRGGARVTLLEASPRLGGKLHADEIAGVPVDLGAESMLARRPEAADLARETGLGDDLEPPAVLGAGLWTRGRLRPMPKGHVMGVPGDLGPLAASGVLSAAGLARLPLDHVLPRTDIGDDVAVGHYVAARLGHEVVDRLVEPLLGGVYAGNSYELSLRAAVPQLYAAARDGRSLIEAARDLQRKAPAGDRGGPVFHGIRGGVGRLPLAVAAACRAAGVTVETGVAVRELRRTGTRLWRLGLSDGRALTADAVVLATPAPATARLLSAESPAAAAELGAVEYASMALVTMAFRRSETLDLPQSSGFLVPPVDGHTIKASTFSSRKWGWLDRAGGDTLVLRTSVGRHGNEADLAWDDTDMVRISREDLREAVGLRAAPIAARVTRWEAGLPQYAVGHVDRVRRVREQVGKLPGLAVCGAVYDGVGIPACIGGARRAAAEVLPTLLPGARRGAGE
ncbi:protoporphyrinogen oxidase [Actinacidiphila acididurans]|uniref:Coproporphyrinogen III oxidase n=1 Tax=Actinacidiphila acididurans TaxID=2784346 RepID=A0ABS2TVK5_9ACTN|nr:protoporphyrinogen oxidase [Actinacidiphila acididurans]MBM9507369.1 protoporphyrinogen oxidase [Actinacidiphila acididurans]